MAKAAERLRAYALRRQGLGVKEIAHTLGVSPSSVSVWVQDMPLTPPQAGRIRERMIAAGHKGRMMGAAANHAKKLADIRQSQEDAAKKITELTPESLFYIGLGLYWGEGVKAAQSSTAVINSDPRVILVMMRWFSEWFAVERSDFRPRIFISDTHRDREETLLRYWSDTLNLPRSLFTKTVFLPKRKKVYENRDIYYGVLALRIRRGTRLKYRIIALLERIAELT